MARSASFSSLLKCVKIDGMAMISTTKAMVIFTGNPIARRLNCGCVFIIIPKIISEKRIIAKIGNAIQKPTTKRFPKALTKYSTLLPSNTKLPNGTESRLCVTSIKTI